MSDVQMPAWLSKFVEDAMRLDGNDESWATPTHTVGAAAVEANGDVCSDYASDLVGLLVDEIEQLRELICNLSDGENCSFDHHGGCQTHGYLSLEPGERCPMGEANEIAARAAGGGK